MSLDHRGKKEDVSFESGMEENDVQTIIGLSSQALGSPKASISQKDRAAHKDSRIQAHQKSSTQNTLQREKRLGPSQAEKLSSFQVIHGADFENQRCEKKAERQSSGLQYQRLPNTFQQTS
ncbi:hypothetical protein WISP_47477 [Willisornis vidua]|uniref:CE295 protein n=1 Tax=Willisornis vidua TaxID=1566151 RepID=A0ABQ9DJZ2_9PASS|nr:hypothetical protein WISP_47477 [Willisornis vidua]